MPGKRPWAARNERSAGATASCLDERARLREHLIERVGETPAPSPDSGGGSWTLVQVLQHLMLVEEVMLARWPKPGEVSTGRTARDRIGRVIVAIVFRLGLRVRTPSRRVVPAPPLHLDEIERRWRAAASELDARIRSAAAAAPREVIFRHPVSGPQRPLDAARFLLRHARHHERQLDRIEGRPLPRS